MAASQTRLERRRRRGGTGGAIAVALVMACSSVACSPGPASPFFGDEKFLVLGVSPEEEADAVSKQLAVDGRAEYLRLRGPAFTALGFTEPDGRPAWVRAITVRGIALALDPTASHLLDRGERYELLAPATPGVFDADGDGFDNLIVLKSGYDGGAVCLLAYRIQSSGFVDLITNAQDTLDAARDANRDVPPCSGWPAEDGGVSDGSAEPATPPAP